MKKRLVIFLLMLLLPITASAYEIRNEVLTSWDVNVNVYSTADSGYVVISSNNSDSGTDGVVTKYNNKGKIEWEQVYNRFYDDGFNTVIQTSDGGFMAVGYSDSENDLQEGLIVKYDKDGKIEFEKNISESNSSVAFSYAEEITDGGYLVSGKKGNQNIWIRIDHKGNEIWKSYNDEVTITSDGGYIAAYKTTKSRCLSYSGNRCEDSLPYPVLVVEKYNENGILEWEDSDAGNEDDYFGVRNIVETSDKNYLVLYSFENQNGLGFYWKKYDQDGNVLWDKEMVSGEVVKEKIYGDKIVSFTFDGEVVIYSMEGELLFSKSFGYWFYDCIEAENGDIILFVEEVLGGRSEYSLVRLDKEFNEVNKIDLIDSIGNDFKYYSTADEGIIVVGNYYNGGNDSGIVVAKYDLSGNEIWSKLFNENDKDFMDIVSVFDNSVIFKGKVFVEEATEGEGTYSYFVTKVSADYSINEIPAKNGNYSVIQENGIGKISINSDKGYELDEILIKDSDGNSIEYAENNGEYYFDLKDNLSVEVIYKKMPQNPNTGVFISIIFVGLLIISVIAYYILKRISVTRYSN